MEPKPVITYYGDTGLLGTVLQKKLQNRLKQLQQDTPSKEEGPRFVFNSLCSGVTFTVFSSDTPPAHPPYACPTLHTFWTSCVDSGQYRNHTHPMIEQWLKKCRSGDSGVECLIVYVVTAEVRTKRTRTLTTRPVEEKIRVDYKAKADDVITFRLSDADSDSSRLAESYSAFTNKINTMCLTRFQRIIERDEALVSEQRQRRVEPEDFYSVFVKKLDLAVTLEMTLQSEKALHVYTEAISDLESALSQFAATPPSWLEKMCHAPCTSWDYPKLVWSQLSWDYLPGVRDASSPLLHVRTFFLARLAHLLFALGRAWSVSELVISTLHCMAREITTLKLSFPDGAFNCWAYMTCNEAIQAFMALISSDSLQSATSSLLLVRAELWHYALEKLKLIGELCGVMPSSNKLNHDQVLITKITSGIHPVPLDSVPTAVPGIEDQGKKLIDTLNDRQTFQTEFLRLGEMVIGAFKYAGRRRMAFKVGTTIAQFHKNLGLVVEAEELLSDICKFYSEDQWTQLSTNAFSLLADCQIKLKLEDKYVSTMLLLASLPPYPGASHDPTKWLSSLTNIAQRSPYQKLLNWEPLLQLRSVAIVGGVSSVTVGETVSMEIKLLYQGPTTIRNLIATAELRSEATPRSVSSPSSPPHTHTSPPHTPPLSSLLTNMDDLDLNSDQLLGSRPIGGEGKHRALSQMVTHISSAEIAELIDEEGGRGKPPDMLRKMGVVLEPGENKLIVSGKVARVGDCHPSKLSLKWGCLDFVYTTTNAPRLSVQPVTVNLELLLLSEYGVFLEGCSHDCHMTVKVGPDTTIPENALIRLDAGVEVTSSDNLSFTLPSMSSGQSHDCHLTLTVAANKSHDIETSDSLVTWTHEVTAYCEWLSPLHIAVLPVRVYRPLTVRVCEHCGGERTFLQVELVNTCPLPLALKDTGLNSSLALSALHTDPEILYPRESYSMLWLVGKAKPILGAVTKATLMLSYLPCIHDNSQTAEYRHFTYSFEVSDMQPVFELRVYVDSKDQSELKVGEPATVTYHLRTTHAHFTLHTLTTLPPAHSPVPKHAHSAHPTVHSISPSVLPAAHSPVPKQAHSTHPTTHSTTPTPTQLNYRVSSDVWKATANEVGVVKVPGVGETVRVLVEVTPTQSGQLPFPTLVLSLGGVKLGNGQIYNLFHGHMVTVGAPAAG